MKIALLTLSDKGYNGERIDQSGQVMETRAGEIGEVVLKEILPDERVQISTWLRNVADQGLADLVLTSGGTGLSPRDITPEATLDILERQVPGIPEAMRAYSMQITNRAMLSRGVCGIRNRTLIINLPGSPKAVSEYMDVILPVLPHAVAIMTGADGECARK